MRKHILSLFALLLVAQLGYAAGQPVTAPEDIPDYWASIDGQKGDNLFNALSSATAKNYSSIGYDPLYDAYKKTDVYPADSGDIKGQLWDMYAECKEWGKGKCGTYNAPCDCYNREHSIPQSYWGGGTGGIGCDIFHVVPTDGKINGVRSNYEYGIVGTIDTKTDYSNYNGNKLGSASSWSTDKATIATAAGETVSGSGKVFEPNSQYKGDLARGIMGAIVKWKKDVTTSNDFFDYPYNAAHYYGLSKKAVVLLMKWHREDPVSRKEVDRNNGIQQTQGNRNPFIDYPYLAEYIWGEHAGETLDMSKLLPSTDPAFVLGESDGQRNTTDPAITSPKGTINLGATNINESNTYDMSVKGINLEDGNLTLSISGTNASFFSLATYTVTKAQAEAENGYTISVTYLPTSEGNHSATLTINGCGVSDHKVTLVGTCTAVHTITWSSAEGEQTTKAATGAIPPLPTNAPADCSEDRLFMGWTEIASYSGETEPTDLFTTPSAISGPKTFFAVYADAERTGGGMPTYTLASSIAAGDQVVIACNSEGKTAGALSSQVLSNVSSTFSSDKSTITTLGSGTLIFTVGGTSGAYTLSTEDGALGATAVKKLAFDSGTTTWDISISNGTASITNTTESYGSLKYNSQSPRFTTYASGQKELQLYKVTGGTTYSEYSLLCNEDDPTRIDQPVQEAGVAEKILINGHLYILRDNVLYDLRGAKVTNR